MSVKAQQATVVVSYGNRGVAETESGERLDCQYRRSVGRPSCGDQVRLEIQGDGSAAVVSILPRRNEFVRADARQRKQVIAANLDQVLIVFAPSPAPSRDIVDRYIVASRSLGITPVLVLNKADLLDEDQLSADNPISRLDDYSELGLQVVRTSCAAEPGVASLDKALKDRTSILVGQSGVGKSSLVNELLPDLELQTGELSRVTGKGTHTTTTTIMYTLPCGGRLVDSPGVWEYGLWDMEPRELISGYPELQPWAGQCRFNNCLHDHEPACAVRSAAESGEAPAWRYESYLRLLKQG